LRSFAAEDALRMPIVFTRFRSVWLNAFRPYKPKALLSHAKVILPLCLAAAAFHAGFVPLVRGVLFRGRGFLFGGGSTCFSALAGFFSFSFFLGGFLDPGKLAQDFHALLGVFGAAVQ